MREKLGLGKVPATSMWGQGLLKEKSALVSKERGDEQEAKAQSQ